MPNNGDKAVGITFQHLYRVVAFRQSHLEQMALSASIFLLPVAMKKETCAYL